LGYCFHIVLVRTQKGEPIFPALVGSRPTNGKKSNPRPPIPKSNNFDIHPTPTQKYKKKIKPNPSNNIIDPKPTRNWVETHENPVGLTYCLISSQLRTHTLIHSDNFIVSFNDIQKHSPRHTKTVIIILYTDTKTSLVDEHLGPSARRPASRAGLVARWSI
jgi:hypothetical protein